MQERSVLASFLSQSDALDAAKRIQALGIKVTKVDELHAYPGPPPARDSFIISGEIPSLASITLGTSPGSRDAGVLLSADPAASGMADGEGQITRRNWLLTVVCPESAVDKVVETIRQCGGYT
jgi:hypothetical protein